MDHNNIHVEVVESNEGIFIYSQTNHADYSGPCNLHLVHVYDWYDYQEVYLTNCSVLNNKLQVELQQPFARGLYLLCYITVNEDEIVYGEQSSQEYKAAAIFLSGKNLRVLDESAIRLYYDVIKHRETVLLEKKGDIENGTTEFDVYVFVKNINVATSIDYGDITVIPFNKYMSLSESKMIDAFFSDNEVQFDYSSTLKDGYGAVICMRNIMSDENGKYAKQLAYKKARILVNLYSIANLDNAKIVACVAKKLHENTYSIQVYDPIYQGNLLRLVDQGYAIRSKYVFLSNHDSKIYTYIKLFNEAISEQDRMASFFKLWVILEIMVEAKNINDSDIKYWDGELFFNKKGQRVKIQTELDSVFELIRLQFSNNKRIDFIKINSIMNVKDFLSVCYQRRCCYAHWGGCNTNDISRCAQNKKECRLCRDNLSSTNGMFDDPVWNCLQRLVRDIIFKEFETVIVNNEARESQYVESLLSDFKPSCKDVKKIKPENYGTTSASRDEVIAQGYSPCGHCNP